MSGAVYDTVSNADVFFNVLRFASSISMLTENRSLAHILPSKKDGEAERSEAIANTGPR